MSNINFGIIDENFPVQGKDNPSQGFRNNFNAIKSALTIAKDEISALETTTAKLNDENNFESNLLTNAITNNIQELFRSFGPTNFLATIDVTEAAVQKISFTGNTVIRFSNWPTNSDIGRCHKIRLHIQFNLEDTPDIMDRRINFTTDQGGIIKSYTTGAPIYYNAGLGGWHLKPYINEDISSAVNDYEHVLEVWSYNGGNSVFIKYLGSFT